MEFPPVGKKKLVEQHPKLKTIVGDLVDDKMLRYVLLMYDINSPLKNHYPELAKRKEWAASLAGYDVESEEVKSLYTLTIECTETSEDGKEKKVIEPHEELVNMITNIIAYQNNRTWTMIVTNEQTFYEYHKRVMMEISEDGLKNVQVKTSLLQAMDEIDSRLEVYYRRISGEDGALEDAITKKRRITAESLATR
jgi:hypothetical protein